MFKSGAGLVSAHVSSLSIYPLLFCQDNKLLALRGPLGRVLHPARRLFINQRMDGSE